MRPYQLHLKEPECRNITGTVLEMKLEPMVQLRDTNNREVVFTLATKGRKHILMPEA